MAPAEAEAPGAERASGPSRWPPGRALPVRTCTKRPPAACTDSRNDLRSSEPSIHRESRQTADTHVRTGSGLTGGSAAISSGVFIRAAWSMPAHLRLLRSAAAARSSAEA